MRKVSFIVLVSALMKKLSILTLVVLLFVVFSVFPAYAEGSQHTGPPDIHMHVRDQPFAGIPAYCDGYHVQATGIRDNEYQVWLNDDGSVEFERLNLREEVTLTNSQSGTSVDLIIRLTVDYEYNPNIYTMSGIRSFVVRPGGSREELSNVGHLVVSGTSIFEGDVLDAAGVWAAVTDNVFDHRSWPCELVAD